MADRNVGKLLGWFNRHQLGNRTLAVFFSNHGEMGGSHGLYYPTTTRLGSGPIKGLSLGR